MERKKVKRVSFLAGLMLVSGLMLSACGDSAATNPPAPAATTAASTTAVTTAATTSAAATSAAVTTVAALPTATPIPATTLISTPTRAVAGLPDLVPGSTSTAVPTAAPTTAAATSAPATTSAGGNSFWVFYLRGRTLAITKPDGSERQALAENVYRAVQAGDNQAVYLQESGSGAAATLQLKWVRFANGAKSEAVLDSQINQQNSTDPGANAIYSGRVGLALSPDNSQIAYIKTNPAGPGIETNLAGSKQRPTEIWVANLDPQNPAPKRLVPNDKDFVYAPAWSTDGNRIAFMRTNGFGTGAGFPTALWSVYKDGTRLAYLTGPELAKIGDRTLRASPATNLLWVGPQVLTYQAFNQISASLMLHDLGQSKDTSQVLDPDADISAAFCSSARRFVYTRINLQGPTLGLFSVEVDKPGNAPTTLDEKAEVVFGCRGDTVLYADNTRQVYLQKLDGPKVKIGFAAAANSRVKASLSPNGKSIVIVTEDPAKNLRNASLFRADGLSVLMGGAALDSNIYQLDWLNDQVVALTGSKATSPGNTSVSVINVEAPNPMVKSLDDIGGVTIITAKNIVY